MRGHPHWARSSFVAGVMARLPYCVYWEPVFLKLANMMGHDLAIWRDDSPPGYGRKYFGQLPGFRLRDLDHCTVRCLYSGHRRHVWHSTVHRHGRKAGSQIHGVGDLVRPDGLPSGDHSQLRSVHVHPSHDPPGGLHGFGSDAASLPDVAGYSGESSSGSIFCLIHRGGIWLAPQKAIKCFLLFGNLLNCVLYVVFALDVVEYFTGLGSLLWPGWEFYPIVADAADSNRALETAGYCAMMLGGAYPMMYLLQKYCGSAIAKLGNQMGITSMGCLCIIASSVTLVAMFLHMEKMPPLDKVRSAAWANLQRVLSWRPSGLCYNFQRPVWLSFWRKDCRGYSRYDPGIPSC